MRKLSNNELDRLSIAEFKQHKKANIILVLDNVRSHLNVGSVFRTADAFLAEAIYLCGITGVPPHRDIHKSALGATETVQWKYFETTQDAVTNLKAEGYQIVSIEQAENATLLTNFTPETDAKYAVVFGNEVNGVEQQIVSASQWVVEIPQFGMKHSLNVSVSAGIVLWDMVSKLNSK